ncbi:MAG TPA: hypothetical protein VK961_18390 [Chthoniobacter sp.]|nr:hypothetical protein [Chthoniobacter sp.]
MATIYCEENLSHALDGQPDFLGDVKIMEYAAFSILDLFIDVPFQHRRLLIV